MDYSSYDLIFLFGPPLFDKLSYLPQSIFRQNTVRVFPSKLFEDNPTYGLRDLSLKIISDIKKDRQVFVEDELCSKATRTSILNTVQKKVPGNKALLVKIIPEHGLEQVLWTHYNAHGTGLLTTCTCQHVTATAKHWFHLSQQSVDYLSGFVDEPDKREGFEILEVRAPFQIQSNFKLEVPALFIQWEAVLSESGDLNTGLHMLCQKWISLNQQGRIIILTDGIDLKSSCKGNDKLKKNLKDLCIKINHPVYAVKMVKIGPANNFCHPPMPGALAFLQTRHLLDLQAKHTVYIFESTDHMKMANAAGIKCVKSKKAYRYYEKTLSGLCSNPPIPKMLKEIKIVKTNETDNITQYPLVEKAIESEECFVSHIHKNGMEEQLFAPSSLDMLNKTQNDHEEHNTATNETSDKTASLMEEDSSSVSCSKPKQRRLDTKKDSVLPVWMTRRLNRKSTESSTSGVESDEQQDSLKFTKTVYLMSEKELKDFAVQVLKQAGKPVPENVSEPPLHPD